MANTLFIGKVYHRFESLGSTNDWARAETAKNKPPEGMVVRADRQSAGRGQFGSRWESTPGTNLTLSVLLYPHWLEAMRQFELSMAVALGVGECVEMVLGSSPTLTPPPTPPQGGKLPSPPGEGLTSVRRPQPQVKIKWPNDLYLDARKTGGILIENTLAGSEIQSSVIGIGLNINQLAFSPDLPNPTSLALAAGRIFDVDAVAETLFECLERRYLQLKAGRREAIRMDYLAALYRFGERSVFQRTADGSAFEGIIRGVSENGYLKIETAAGLEHFDLKQVKFLS